MGIGVKESIIKKFNLPLAEYDDVFRSLLEIAQDIENTLQRDTEFLSEIRRDFNNLSATVELEYEGTTVFDQEIKRTRELLDQSVAKVNESLIASNRIGEDLDNIADLFEKIRNGGVQLEHTIKDINMVSDSIEVASRNAGITAFHAGSQGKGFEVIAREMTSLVRSAQKPTRIIPEVSSEIIKGMVDLGAELQNIRDINARLKEINSTFFNITDDLLALIPKIESGIQDISQSIVSQKELHSLLLKENEKLSDWLTDMYDTARSSAIVEISLEAFFRQINNIKESFIEVEDDVSFFHIYNAFKIALLNVSAKHGTIAQDLIKEAMNKRTIQTSDRSILLFVSEAKRLLHIIEEIADEIKNWSKTNTLAADVLSKGVVFYQDTVEIVGRLNNALHSLKTIAYTIDQPLQDLKKITERSKLLGLYAGIESARGDSSLLDIVTHEIQSLSERTTTFVDKIGEIANDMLKNFKQLSPLLIKSMSDVEQGIGCLKFAIGIFEENRKVLENLDNLSREMNNSTTKMVNQCNTLSSRIRTLNADYEKINRGFQHYVQSIQSGSHIARNILDIVDHYEKDVSILKKQQKTVVFRNTTDPIILDPANKTDATSQMINAQLFVGLLTFDSSNHIIPGIADTFSVSKDGTEWDFTLKRGVTFHNGEVLMAQDVIDTIARVKRGPNVSAIDYIDDVIMVDDNRVRFILKYPYLPFLTNLACGVCDITPKDFSDKKPVGAGPYEFLHWEMNKEIAMKAFEDFTGGRVPIDVVIMKIIPDDHEAVARYKRGEISVMRLSPNMIKEFDPDEIVSGPILATQYLGINVSMDTPFNNKKVRQAMNYALDKDYFAGVLMEGQAIAARGVFPPGMASYNEKLVGYPVDIRQARELMREAGYEHGINGSFVLDINDTAWSIRQAEYIRDSFEKIGITIVLNPLPWRERLDKSYRGESLLCLQGWVSDNGDPDNFLYPLFHSKSFGRSGNTTFYQNEEIDEVMEAARAERDSKRRTLMYQKIEEVIVDDAPWVFISHSVDSYAISKKIGGFKVDPFGLVRFQYLWSS
ncbi:MAG: hypothetical protein JSV97_07100 [candidate division WOR-3 bacterium]|nr:MAG: hypothetical protein JSV97_07100 [candidate division WOR-3 bacterium]